MGTLVGEERHISNLCFRLVVDLVRARDGEEAVDELLRRSGDDRPFDVLTDDAQWSSYAQFRRLLEAAAAVLGEVEALSELAGHVELTGGSMPSSTEMLQAFGSPHALIAETAKGHNGIMTMIEAGGEQTGPTEWLLTHRHRPGFEPFPEFCAFAAGLQSLTPLLFGYDHVAVSHETCQIWGDPHCSFRLYWMDTDDVTAERNALQQRVTLLERRIEVFQETVGELVSAENVDTALERIVTAASRAVRAPGFVLAVEPTLRIARRVHSIGLSDEDAERIAGQLLASAPCPDVNPDVAEIVSSHRHYGLLAAYDPEQMMMPDAGLLHAYARLAASALDAAAALEEARQEAERARALLTLSSALSDITSVEAMAASLARATTAVIGADRAVVAVADWDTTTARLVGVHGFDPAVQASMTGAAVPLYDMTDRIRYYSSPDEVNDQCRPPVDAEPSIAHVAVPIVLDGRTEAWLTASVTERPERLAPSDELEARLHGLAAQAATALRNARLVEQIRHQALHDALTGLPNRLLILDRAEQLLARARREHTPVSALFLDLDGFKEINDTLGHGAGDQLLCAVATRLGTAIRESDTLARLGGDEFIVLVDGANLDLGPDLVAERMLEVLRAPFVLDGREETPLTVTASIGIATSVDRSSAGDLLRDADVALYRAKAAGKNCSIMFAPEMRSAVRDRLELEMDLRVALEHDQFFLAYQPMFDLRSGAVNGVEALLRWAHPERGVVLPDRFIPVLEETGLIVPVGRWVLEEACRQAAQWHAAGAEIDVSVNVSGRQIDGDQLARDVHDALERSGLDPSSLILEVTETTIMRDTEATIRRLSELKALGVRIAIDDFGTGYSSLAYLRQFPVDTLKIDRSFIHAIAESSEASALIHTLVSLGKALGLATLAEGIEDDQQLQRLRNENCDRGQGFLYSKPLSSADLERFLGIEDRDRRLTEISPI